jgi:hypothetical protein
MERMVIVPTRLHKRGLRHHGEALDTWVAFAQRVSLVVTALILAVLTSQGVVNAYDDASPVGLKQDRENPASASNTRLAAVNKVSSSRPSAIHLSGKTSAADAPSPALAADLTASTPNPLPKRFRVRDEYGQLVAARWYGKNNGKTALILPDGQLGIANTLVPTDEPFAPLSADQLRELLHQGPYAEYQVLTSPHYLIFYKSTLTFAEDSARLLETLYRGLIDVFRRHDIPVREAEFPLVAVIFATEEDFRSHKEVDREVQAYYEVFTNRIFFYQRSSDDQSEPRLAALRKPQTVAHEGAHQILANLGVQPRLTAWPLWLVEGLAEYCATPVNSKKKGIVWDGPGMINSLHMVTLRELDQPVREEPSAESRLEASRGGRDKRISRTESLLLKDRLTPTDYAEAWALTHYLAQKRSVEFVKFLREMSQIPPLEPRTPAQNLAIFTKNFNGGLPKLDKRVDEYIYKLSQQRTYDPLPYYTVIFEQPIAVDRVRRAVFISQSPQMIERWVDQMTVPNGVDPTWQALKYPTRSTAYDFASHWMRGD